MSSLQRTHHTLTPRRAEQLESAAQVLTADLRRNIMRMDNYGGKPHNGSIPGNDWGFFAYMAVYEAMNAADLPGGGSMTEPVLSYYLLSGRFKPSLSADALHDAPILLKRVAILLGANPEKLIELRDYKAPAPIRGGVQDDAAAPIQPGHVLVTPATAQPWTSITYRWPHL